MRLAPRPDEDARLVWFWTLAAVVVIDAANGLRDILLSPPGATWERGALLGIIVAAFAAAVRLAAILRVRAPLRDLIRRAFASEESEPATPVRMAANLWPIAFSILVVVDFTGLVYHRLLVGGAGFAPLDRQNGGSGK